ncbi:S-adenosyl-L-methionine-dependent methyltransferase [Mycena galopus ATCC 62051]|nr:S-adenosyl-L-methionine-dependent methyltransferase [Mycena galopus ATCC 62051]
MTIHGQVFCNGETFELVISELESGGTCYQRILFKVHAMLDATPPSESYLQGTMFFLFSDYVEALSLDQNVPQSAVCDASDAFLINPRTTIDGSGMHLFMVDLPVSQIIHIVRHLVLIFKSEHQSSQVVPQVRCQWVYTSVSSKQEYFTPILHGDEKIPPMPTQLSVGDFFCGAGGFSAGFRRAGFHIQLGVDEDLPAYQSWKLNHPTAETHAEEINDLIELKKQGIIPLPQVQIALISPPCQGFSTANPGGKNDEKNCSLLQTVADIAVAFQPYWICVENVPGLFRPQHRADLRRLEMSLLKLGYSVSVAEQCASNFGVPQTRRRLILFATQRGLTQPNFPSIRYAWDSPDHLPLVTLRSAILDLNHDNPRPVNDRRNPHYPRPHYTSSYFTEYTRLLGSDTVTQIANHATGYHCSSEKIKHWPVAVWDEPACTVRTSPGNRWPCVHPDGQRPLTVRELARIQSFPDDYHFEGEIKDQYRQVGNAVPPLLAEAWALELRIAILVDYPALADQFDNIEAFKPTSVGRKRRADELDDTAEGKGTKRLRKSEQ